MAKPTVSWMDAYSKTPEQAREEASTTWKQGNPPILPTPADYERMLARLPRTDQRNQRYRVAIVNEQEINWQALWEDQQQ